MVESVGRRIRTCTNDEYTPSLISASANLQRDMICAFPHPQHIEELLVRLVNQEYCSKTDLKQARASTRLEVTDR